MNALDAQSSARREISVHFAEIASVEFSQVVLLASDTEVKHCVLIMWPKICSHPDKDPSSSLTKIQILEP